MDRCLFRCHQWLSWNKTGWPAGSPSTQLVSIATGLKIQYQPLNSLQNTVGRQSLHSADLLTCTVQRTRMYLGDRSFSTAGTCLRNSLCGITEWQYQSDTFKNILVWVGLGRTVTLVFALHMNTLTYLLTWWRGGTTGRASDLRFTGHGLESWLGTIA